jgi:hypothetical protein
VLCVTVPNQQVPNQQLYSPTNQGPHQAGCTGGRARQDHEHIAISSFYFVQMAALQSSLAQQQSRSLLRQPLISKSLYSKRNVQSLLARQRQHIAPSPWQTSGSSTAALAAASAAVAALPEPDRLIDQPLQRLCKNVLVGVAAAAAWSVAASVFGGSSSPLASLTIAFQPGASSAYCIYRIQLCMHGSGCPAAVDIGLQAVLTCCGAQIKL